MPLGVAIGGFAMAWAAGYCTRMTEILPATPDGIARAAELLRGGALVAFGTETVYGLGGDATNAAAVAAIFAAKGRPGFNPLICHYPAAEAAFADVTPNDVARSSGRGVLAWAADIGVAQASRSVRVALIAGAGLDTLAVRVPAHREALAIAGAR